MKKTQKEDSDRVMALRAACFILFTSFSAILKYINLALVLRPLPLRHFVLTSLGKLDRILICAPSFSV